MPEEIFVYRIEDPNTGYGPYHSDLNIELRSKLCSAHANGDEYRPNGSADFSSYVDNFRFAVLTLEKSKEWFGDFFVQLLDSGFILTKYLVKDYKIGKSDFGQVMFNAETAIKITENVWD